MVREGQMLATASIDETIAYLVQGFGVLRHGRMNLDFLEQVSFNLQVLAGSATGMPQLAPGSMVSVVILVEPLLATGVFLRVPDTALVARVRVYGICRVLVKRGGISKKPHQL